MAVVRVEGLEKRYGPSWAVRALDLEMADGRVTVLVGPSGCGKTTTLRMIAGLEIPTAGRILIGDRDVTPLEPKERDVAMVFQNYALYPHMTVFDNIAFGLRAQHLPNDEIRARVEEAADLLDVGAMLGRKPKALSGGQQQRVAIGRAIVRRPSVFLFDEPLSNLDAKLRVEMRTEIHRLQRELKTTLLHVTHDQEEAMTLADEMVVMRDGELVQRGRPADVYARPANVFVAQFIGSPEMNMIEGEARQGGFTSPLLTVERGLEGTGQALLGVRPEAIHLAADLGPDHRAAAFRSRIEVTEQLGAHGILSLRTATGTLLKAVVDSNTLHRVAEAEEREFALDREGLHLFDRDSGDRLTDSRAPSVTGSES
jgi:multiple sugar transport system ATP-binding protein